MFGNFYYQVGNSLLVRPVTDAGVVSADVLLPKGELWYNYFTGKPMEAGVQHTGKTYQIYILDQKKLF